ncbi:hypothetical protein RB195_007600 [Necator americanus]|uniref:Uncharacterized protein n=1 Tax=Necator americanus TaxID=51031 RepID=A0ABR1C1B1_NECAM
MEFSSRSIKEEHPWDPFTVFLEFRDTHRRKNRKKKKERKVRRKGTAGFATVKIAIFQHATHAISLGD